MAMHADWATARPMVGRHAAPVGFAPPRRRGAGMAKGARAAAAVRRLLAALAPPCRRFGGGPHDRSDEEAAFDRMWHDPAFWLWMMH
jgi:hypothetical protein